MSNWKPIETAPQNQGILVTNGEKVNVVYIHRHEEHIYTSPHGVFSYDAEPELYYAELTHWQPLPEPP